LNLLSIIDYNDFHCSFQKQKSLDYSNKVALGQFQLFYLQTFQHVAVVNTPPRFFFFRIAVGSDGNAFETELL